MKLLILGYSDFARRRIIPILLKDFKKINIAISTKSRKFNYDYKNVQWFKDYDKAINEFKPDIVYISLPNSLHFKWAKKSLNKNIHVVVDKPITLKLAHSKELIKLSIKKKRLLAEATIFTFHKQIKKSIKLLSGCGKIRTISANFCLPITNKKEIKLSDKYGGGVNNDMGPYAASTFREFYKVFPEKIYKMKEIKNNVVTKLSVLAKYKNKHFIGHFSFGMEYKNDILFFSDREIVTVNTVFSPNPFLDTEIVFKTKNIVKKYRVNMESSFKNFLKLFLSKIKKNNYKFFHQRIIYDSKFREILND